MSRYHGSLLCQVAGLVALLVITGTLVLLPRHSAVADEGAIDPLANTEGQHAAYSGNDFWINYRGHAADIKGLIDNLGYVTLKEEYPTKDSAVAAAPSREVWYSLSDGGVDAQERFVCLCFGINGGDLLYAADLPGGLAYRLVFLNGCKSATGDGPVFAQKFGTQAYVGWKKEIAQGAAVPFAKAFFAALKGRNTVGQAVTAGINSFSPGSWAYQQVVDNITILKGQNVVVDLSSK
jgi:hypothetical protein